jgi:hypothetical protein
MGTNVISEGCFNYDGSDKPLIRPSTPRIKQSVSRSFLKDLRGSERARIEKRSHNYKQFPRLHAALERAEALRARVLPD